MIVLLVGLATASDRSTPAAVICNDSASLIIAVGNAMTRQGTSTILIDTDISLSRPIDIHTVSGATIFVGLEDEGYLDICQSHGEPERNK